MLCSYPLSLLQCLPSLSSFSVDSVTPLDYRQCYLAKVSNIGTHLDALNVHHVIAIYEKTMSVCGTIDALIGSEFAGTMRALMNHDLCRERYVGIDDYLFLTFLWGAISMHDGSPFVGA